MRIQIVLEHEPYGSAEVSRYKKPFIAHVVNFGGFNRKKKLRFGNILNTPNITESLLEIEAEEGDILIWGQTVHSVSARLSMVQSAFPVQFYGQVKADGTVKKTTAEGALTLWKEERDRRHSKK